MKTISLALVGKLTVVISYTKVDLKYLLLMSRNVGHFVTIANFEWWRCFVDLYSMSIRDDFSVFCTDWCRELHNDLRNKIKNRLRVINISISTDDDCYWPVFLNICHQASQCRMAWAEQRVDLFFLGYCIVFVSIYPTKHYKSKQYSTMIKLEKKISIVWSKLLLDQWYKYTRIPLLWNWKTNIPNMSRHIGIVVIKRVQQLNQWQATPMEYWVRLVQGPKGSPTNMFNQYTNIQF